MSHAVSVCTREREKKFDGENSSFVHARHKNIMLLWERCVSVPVRAWMSMNNALAVGVFIYNTLKMFACELRHMLKAS